VPHRNENFSPQDVKIWYLWLGFIGLGLKIWYLWLGFIGLGLKIWYLWLGFITNGDIVRKKRHSAERIKDKQIPQRSCIKEQKKNKQIKSRMLMNFFVG